MRGLQEPGGNPGTPIGQVAAHEAGAIVTTASEDTGRTASRPYRGRFAPSPTGPLHYGSLVAALASFLQARSRGGEWLVRIEDLDTPRIDSRAARPILAILAAYGLEWDGPVMIQSERTGAYQAALDRLLHQGDAFPCACTRREARAGSRGPEGPIYPGHCRNGVPAGRHARSVRARVRSGPIHVDDAVCGRVCQDLAKDVGDFVIRRADGLFAYQLAVVVDDAEQGITDVVRGADLLTSTPRQVFLQRLLGLPTPGYLHTPLACLADGRKLSKQHGADALAPHRPGPALIAALADLGQSPPADLSANTPRGILEWAVAHWRVERIPAAIETPRA